MDFVELIGMIEPPDDVRKDLDCRQRRTSESSTTSSTSTTNSSGTIYALPKDEIRPIDEAVPMLLESTSKGKVKGNLWVNYLTAGAGWPALFVLVCSFLFVQILGSFTDYWVSIWYKNRKYFNSGLLID